MGILSKGGGKSGFRYVVPGRYKESLVRFWSTAVTSKRANLYFPLRVKSDMGRAYLSHEVRNKTTKIKYFNISK